MRDERVRIIEDEKEVRVIIEEKYQVKGEVNDKKNTLTDECLNDIVNSIYYNLCYIYTAGVGDSPAQGAVELYNGETLIKSLPFSPDDVTIEDITDGKRINIEVLDTSTDEYTFDNLKLLTASSGYRMQNPPAYYATASISSTTKPTDKSLRLVWRISVTKT